MKLSTQNVLPWSVIAIAGWLTDLIWRTRQGRHFIETPVKNRVL
ncbi:MAG TPA: hypothetical protein VN039_03770 [Nitrospira sp.]|nr:hypothetical protein [Nitrospira sp.]